MGFKHLTLTSRCMIEKYLNFGYSFREIAAEIGCQPSTISREVKNNRTIIKPKNPICRNYVECRKHTLCDRSGCTEQCKKCDVIRCVEQCEDYLPRTCSDLEKAPFVCNNCQQQEHCTREHAFYLANKADAKSRSTLTKSRQFIHIDKEEADRLNCLVTPLILQGQSLNHIYATHSEDIGVSKRTMYNYIDKCILDARNIDLPRKVRYKKRKPKPKEPVQYAYRQGRTYDDFKAFIEQKPKTGVVEMDTVHGKREKGKCLLTMVFTDYDFLLLFLLDACTQSCVQDIFDHLTNALGLVIFRRLFPVILTDNGGEFKNPAALERSTYGAHCTSVFYCDPMASWQKPHIERAHEYIRMVLPKGSSFDDLTQADVTLLNNHINSYSRESLGGICPYDAAENFIGKKLPYVLDLKKIKPDDVVLRPSLIH